MVVEDDEVTDDERCNIECEVWRAKLREAELELETKECIVEERLDFFCC